MLQLQIVQIKMVGFVSLVFQGTSYQATLACLWIRIAAPMNLQVEIVSHVFLDMNLT